MGNQNNSNAQLEYAFDSVPQGARKNGSVIFLILAGYTISLYNFVAGATIGYVMPFKDAVIACALGNIILMLVATVMGVIAQETGLTTTVLSRRPLGMRSSAIFSILIAVSAVNSVAINADTFAHMIKSTFISWPVPIAITSIIVVALWVQSALRGAKGLEFVSKLGVPCAIALVIACAVAIDNRAGYENVFNYMPKESITFAAGSASFVGTWIFGCIVTPDVTRYAKKKSHVFAGAPLAVALGLFGLELIGIMTAQATGEASFVAATAALGLGILVFVCAIFCVWTTQDNNIYSAGLALQNVLANTRYEGKTKHSVMATIIAVFAAAFASTGATRFLLPVTQTQSLVLPPIVGLITAEFFFIKKGKENKAINWVGILAWVISIAAGYISLIYDFLIPPMVGMVAAFVGYIILSKLLDGVWNKDIL